ncbi:G-protein coupled receptor GRL101-like protein [Trichoplax sp. H2]|nr:G-protein coupled receptor GRL101-like protein [Trichoplax sp. H2]|eukprot:RDD39006.1 G-protein coupled receptor GRL101-like protein [Trichoplax sp. H2]
MASNRSSAITGHRVFAPFVTWIPGVLGSLANIAAIIVHCKRFRKNTNTVQRVSSIHHNNGNRLHATPSYLLAHLAFADLIGTFYMTAIAAVDVYLDRQSYPSNDRSQYYQWPNSSFCAVLRFLNCVSTIASSSFAVLIAIERSKLILHYRALSWQDYRITILVITSIIWMIAIITASIVTILSRTLTRIPFDDTYDVNGLCIYLNTSPEILFYSATCYLAYCFISYCLVIIIYAHIIFTLGWCQQSIPSRQHHSRNDAILVRNEIRPWLIFFAIAIAITDATTWLPLSLAILLQPMEINQTVASLKYVSISVILLQKVNMAIHPFIYSSPISNVNNVLINS